MKHYYRTVVLGGLISLALLGCVSAPTFVTTETIENWQLSGKIATIYPKSNCHQDSCSPHSDQGKIRWQQKGGAYSVAVSDPFGRIVVVLNGDEAQLTVKIPNNPPVRATPKDFLTLLVNKNTANNALINLSPNDLRYWVTGRISPAAGKVSESHGYRFKQKGYTIVAEQWRKTEIGQLPSLVNISKGKFKLRFVIRNWKKSD